MQKCLLCCLLLVNGVVAITNIRGSLATQSTKDVIASASLKSTAIDYITVGMGAGIGAVVAGGLIFLAMRKKDDAKEVEGVDEKGEPLLPAEEETKEVDYVELLKGLSKRVADDVGPKFDKGGCVRNVLETRMTTFQDKAKNFMLSEMNDTASAVMKEINAEENSLMLEWNNAVESNFPPASILIAGLMSPTVINCMALNHFVQLLTVALPLVLLCAWAIYVDWSAPCSAIPTIWAWFYTQCVLATILFLGHGCLLSKLHSGKAEIQKKREEVEENLKGTEDGGFSNLKEQFIGNTIILQKALIIENDVRSSFWNKIVGAATVAWLLSTVWNLVLICGWIFVPGVVAFHPAAAKVAGGEFCGAWATVLVLRISNILSVLYLFLNLYVVTQWICDMMISSEGFKNATLKQARKADKDGTGVPIIEMLAKAFVLRGGDESIISRLAVVQHHKKSLQTKEDKLKGELKALTSKISSSESEEALLTAKATSEGGGDIAAQAHKLKNEFDTPETRVKTYDSWKRAGADAMEAAENNAIKIGEANTDALEKMYEDINKVIEEVKNSDTVKAAAAAAAEVQRMAQEKMNEAYEMVNDPEFQAKIREYADKAQAECQKLGEQAQGLANDAIAAASDPEFQRQLQEAAQKAMADAQAMADKAKDAVNDPELQKKLQEAMDDARAKAQEAAANLTDPELQKKMMETANETMKQVQAGAESAANALCDPELQAKMRDQCLEAMKEAEAVAAQAKAALNDPALKEAALAKLNEAKEQAEKAAAMAQDPATRKRFEETARKAMEAAKEIGEQKGAEAQEAIGQASQAASAAAQEVGAKAEEAVKDVKEKAKGKKGKK